MIGHRNRFGKWSIAGLCTATALAGAIAAAPVSFAQIREPSFEVASIRRATTNRYVPPVVTPQRFRIVSTLAIAIAWAYDVRGYQISGGPAWINRDYFQIEASAMTPAVPADIRRMLQRLLAERFMLLLRRDDRERPVYILTTMASGPRLRVANEACGSTGCINVGPGELVAISATMASMAATLSNVVERPVIDGTHLDGRYDFRLKFDPLLVKTYLDQPAPRASTDAPSIFSAIQDLGLKLEAQRRPVDTLFVVRATEPSVD